MTVETTPRLAGGNKKLGKKFIKTFSIPAGSTCPGKTNACVNICYAAEGFFVMPSVKAAYERNLAWSKTADFADQMVAAIQKEKVKVFRIHVSGDFYDAEYAAKWVKIVRKCPKTIFYAYTRSWRINAIKEELEKLNKRTNFHLWLSYDRDTGRPVRFSGKQPRVAYMQVDEHDLPLFRPHLYFRDSILRKKVVKKIDSVLVCPEENGATNTTCEKCAVCWTNKVPTTPYPSRAYLIPLQLITPI